MPTTSSSMWKRAFSVVVAFVLVFTMAIPQASAFASEPASEGAVAGQAEGVQTSNRQSESDQIGSLGLSLGGQTHSGGKPGLSTLDTTSEVVYYDGVYEGTGGGYVDSVTVRVTITDGRIAKVEEVSQREDAPYWEKAKALFGTIVEQQTWNVDAVAGATVSCDGIKQATMLALRKAQLDPNGPFTAGIGTKADPYVISTTEGLQRFATKVDGGENYADKYIELGADLDLSSVESWNPIGTEANATASTATVFAGSFDGAGYTISNMKIALADQTEAQNVGLFSTLQNTASVKGVNLAGMDIDVTTSAVVRAGAVAGDMVSGTAAGHATINACSATGAIDVDSSGAALVFAGGITGRMNGWAQVANCWSDVAVTALSRGGSNSAYAGGITGMAGNNTGIVNCATFGASRGVSPKSTNFGGMAGGLGGMVNSKVYNTYALGAQTAGNGGNEESAVGALAGQIIFTGTTYPETGAYRAFGYYPDDAELAEETWTGETFTSSAVEPRAIGAVNNDDVLFETTAMARADMATEGFATTLNNNIRESLALSAAYSVGVQKLNTWVLQEGRVLPVGPAWIETEIDASIFDSGTGTEEDPYKIRTEEQLRTFAGSLSEGVDYTGKFVEVIADIDVSSAPWVPVGDSEYAFNGTFDGGGFTISGMHMGTTETPVAIENGAVYLGMFSVLDPDAVVKNVKLTDVCFNATHATSFYIGGIAAVMNSRSGATFAGSLVDSCSVDGVLAATAGRGNTFVGGIAGMQVRGAIINCETNVDASCEVLSGSSVAEVGGIVGLVNRGLVANNYSLGNVAGSASRNNGDEGMASISSIAGVNAGFVGNNYGAGGHLTAEHSVYVGAVSGWVTGIGRAYSCYYNGEAPMQIFEQVVNPVESIGTKVPSGVSEEGDVYTGGIVAMLEPYTSQTYAAVADKLNANFAEFPLDFSLFGLNGTEFKKWTYDQAKGLVTFDTEYASATYKQPEAEIVPPVVLTMRDGTWHGRSSDGSLVVSIYVENDAIVGKPRVSGAYDAQAYEEALELAKEKAAYGDTTDYNEPVPSVFAGGSGTADDPYQIATEDQLRYIAERLNADNTWEGVYFLQTADITLSSDEWLPIGWGIFAEVNKMGKQYCVYPFCGNYDGGDFTISGLTIGTNGQPTEDPRMQYAAGFIGAGMGEAYYNDLPQDGDRVVRVSNVHLKDLNVNVASRYQNFVGGLAGNLQNGFYVDNCSVEGNLESVTAESFARAGGMFGNALRGGITNSWSNVEVYGYSETGNAYVGGLAALDNRSAFVNCYVLGNVTAGSGNNNRTNVGGFTGQTGGSHYNCYFAGNVTSEKTTRFAGLLNGNLAGVAVERDCYYRSDATLEVAGAAQDSKAQGVIAHEESKDPAAFATEGKTSEFMASPDFAALLNANVAAASENMATIRDLSTKVTDLGNMVYYTGDGSDLLSWKTEDGHAVFGVIEEEPTPVEVAVPTGKALTYNGKAQTGVAPAEGYILSGNSATNAGSYKAHAKLAEGFTWADGTSGEKEIAWKITPAKLTSIAKPAEQTYAGGAWAPKPTPAVKAGALSPKAGTDFVYTYTYNASFGAKQAASGKYVGAATVLATGKGNYTGTVSAPFKIVTVADKKTSGAKLTEKTVTAIQKLKSGSSKVAQPNSATMETIAKPKAKTMTVKWKAVSGATNYLVGYKRSTAKEWSYVVTGGKTNHVFSGMNTGNLMEFRVATYDAKKCARGEWTKINCRFFRAMVSLKATVGSGKIDLAWGKVSDATGYQVLIGTKKDLSDATVKTVKGTSTLKSTITSFGGKALAKGKTYYVKVRPIKEAKNSNGKTNLYVGINSLVRECKVK